MAIASTNSQGAGGSKKVRVSQATIDSIKKMGMTKALAGAKSANPEMKEALTRMYGASRVAKAAGSATSTAATYKKNNMPAYRPATAGTTNSVAKKTATSASKPKPTSSTTSRGGYKGSDADKFVTGVKKVLNSSPGANLGSTVKKVGAAFTPDWKKKAAAQASKSKTK